MKNYGMGDEFKAQEREHGQKIEGQVYLGLRFDGKAFSTLTRRLTKPFDMGIVKAMNGAAKFLVKETQGALFAYVQSDEITVVVSNRHNPKSELPFGGRVEKLISVMAAQASVKFCDELRALEVNTPKGVLPVFDGRVAFVTTTLTKVEDYLFWRRTDSRINAVQSSCQALYSHRELIGLNTDAQFAKLKGTPFETIDDRLFWGRLIKPLRVEFFEAGQNVTFYRTIYCLEAATKDNVDKLLNELKDTENLKDTE